MSHLTFRWTSKQVWISGGCWELPLPHETALGVFSPIFTPPPSASSTVKFCTSSYLAMLRAEHTGKVILLDCFCFCQPVAKLMLPLKATQRLEPCGDLTAGRTVDSNNWYSTARTLESSASFFFFFSNVGCNDGYLFIYIFCSPTPTLRLSKWLWALECFYSQPHCSPLAPNLWPMSLQFSSGLVLTPLCSSAFPREAESINQTLGWAWEGLEALKGAG